ncbi:MAG: hypothetical protein AAB262_13865, partial [Elusimicrobiota bacterium]
MRAPMDDSHVRPRVLKPPAPRAIVSVLLSLSIVLAPWPAWAQTARVIVAPASAVAGSAVGAVATVAALDVARGMPSASPLLSLAAPALGSQSAPIPTPTLVATMLPAARPAPSIGGAASNRAFPRLAATPADAGAKVSRPALMQAAARIAYALDRPRAPVDDAGSRGVSAVVMPDSVGAATSSRLAPHAHDDVGAAAPSTVALAPAPGLFSKNVIGFLSTLGLVSIIVESTALAVSQMTQPLTQGFMALAALMSR